MSIQRLIRFALAPLTALLLAAALFFFMAGAPTPVAAAGRPDWQQMRGAMPVTSTMPAMLGQMMGMMQQMQNRMGQGAGMMGAAPPTGTLPMTGAAPMRAYGLGAQMEMMGRMMQMMGMMQEMMHPYSSPLTGALAPTTTLPLEAQTMPRMMQMMGMMMQMIGMMEQMEENGLPMMGAARPLTRTMPLSGAMPMGQGMGPGMMEMRGEMSQMMGMMSQMGQMMAHMQGIMEAGMPITRTVPLSGAMPMGQGIGPGMMGMMGEMSQMMGMMQAMMGITMPLTTTAPLSATTGAALPDLPQTAQAGAIEVKVTPTNLHDAKTETIDFAVELNSHSEAINLDLAKTAKLRIGAEEVTPLAWETTSPPGHHVAGVLRFARTDEAGKPLLTDVAELSLVIGGLPDGVEQAFTWQVNPQ